MRLVSEMREQRLKRLERVARLYYEENMTQAEIARELNVSRPLISRMLSDARDEGIVEIKIVSRATSVSPLFGELKNTFGLLGGVLVGDELSGELTNRAISDAAISYIEELGGGHLGIGWGHIIGTIVSSLESRSPRNYSVTDVSPMIGNSGVPIRNYHPNENVRIIGQQTMSKAHYLYTPAVADSKLDFELLLKTEQYKSILDEWSQLDIALVNIGNHPSTPDLGSSARFGNRLSEEKAIGRLIAYYFDVDGNIIQSDEDYVIQIPLEKLKDCPNVIGVCSANTNAKALLGALKSGILTHIIVREELVKEMVLHM